MLTLMVLTGWGFDHAALAPLCDKLADHLVNVQIVRPFTHCPSVDDPHALADWRQQWLSARHSAAQKIVYIGWSLGGLIATCLAQDPRAQPLLLVTLATNRRFVVATDWPHAMPIADFKTFAAAWQRRPASTLQHFARLSQQGGESRQSLASLLDDSLSPAQGLQELNWLADHDLLPAWQTLTCPTLHLFGEHDALVPIAAATALTPQVAVSTIANASHLFPLTHVNESVAAILAQPVLAPYLRRT